MDVRPPSPPELLHSSAAAVSSRTEPISQNGHTATTSASVDTHNRTVDVRPPPASMSTVTINGGKPTCITNRKNKKQTRRDAAKPSSSLACGCTSSSHHTYRGLRVSAGRRNPRVLFGSFRHRETDVDALALPLGMSIAAVIAQVLERTDAAGGRMAVDHLSMICAMAVKESLFNVFGDKFNSFTRSFEKSFRSTLMTLRSINESSQSGGAGNQVFLERESFPTHASCNKEEDFMCNSGITDINSDEVHGISSQERLCTLEEMEENLPSYILNRQLSLHDGLLNQQLDISSSAQPIDKSMLSTLEKSVIEQARSNDLKTFEIGLIMKKLKLKETQLALSSDSNLLERCKLSMDISKASFGAEKFKNQLKDMRHAELLQTCIDCLVAGLFIMLTCLAYGTYVYSHKRITEATASCTPTNDSKSWWILKPMASFNLALQILKCQVQVISRMLFGLLMIFAIAYLLLQRSTISHKTMPITFILLLLGVSCGFAGKFCIDALGGSGYHWLFYWEALCLLHFFSNSFTSALFLFLYGPINMPDRTKNDTIFPYWIRRLLFYATVLLFLPLLCGLMPFASPVEWKGHFSSLVMDFLFNTVV